MIRWLTICFFVFINFASSQTPTLLWSKFAGTASVEYPVKVLMVNDGYLILSRTAAFDTLSCHLNEDIILLKTDTSGNLLWNTCYGGDSSDIPHDIIQTTDGNFLIVGSTYSMEGDITNNHLPGTAFGGWGASDFWVIKVDGLGNKLWQSCYGGSGNEEGYCAVDLTDSYMIFGSTQDSDDGDVSGTHSPSIYDGWIIKIDTSGQLLWQKCIGGSGGDVIQSAVKINDDSIMLGAVSTSIDGDATYSLGQYDYWPLIIDSSANILSQKKLGGSWYENCHSIIKGFNDGFVMIGTTSSNDSDVTGYHGGADIWVVRTDDSGNLIWQNCIGGSEIDESYKIISSGDHYYLAGYSASINGDLTSNFGYDDLWLVQLDTSGNISWQHSYGGSMPDGAFDLVMENDSVLMVAGSTSSHDFDVSNNPGGDVWLLKFKLDYLTSVNDIQLRNELVISPNPSNGFFKLKVPENSVKCTIKITDTFGKIIYYSEIDRSIDGIINLPIKLSGGVYLLTSVIGNMQYFNKVIVQQ